MVIGTIIFTDSRARVYIYMEASTTSSVPSIRVSEGDARLLTGRRHETSICMSALKAL